MKDFHWPHWIFSVIMGKVKVIFPIITGLNTKVSQAG